MFEKYDSQNYLGLVNCSPKSDNSNHAFIKVRVLYFTGLRPFNLYLMRKRAAKKGNSVMVKRIYISAINNDYNGKMILVDNYFFYNQNKRVNVILRLSRLAKEIIQKILILLKKTVGSTNKCNFS